MAQGVPAVLTSPFKMEQSKEKSEAKRYCSFGTRQCSKKLLAKSPSHHNPGRLERTGSKSQDTSFLEE